MTGRTRVKPVRIHWVKDRCTNCISCAVVCAERHTGFSAPAQANIRILVDVITGDYSAAYCRQCPNAPCAVACPAGAISFDTQLRAWLVDEAKCNGCGDCVPACAFHTIQLDPYSGLAAKCDLCLGALRCVEICPKDALLIKAAKGEDCDVD